MRRESYQRLWSLIIKEIFTLFRDPKIFMVLILPPILQLFIFSYAATLEVKNITLALYDQDHGFYSKELIRTLEGAKVFKKLIFIREENMISPLIEAQKVIAVVHIPENFSQRLASGLPVSLAVTLDGRKSNAAQIVSGYLAEIMNRYNLQISLNIESTVVPIRMVLRNWFNENLLYLWFMLPSIVGLLSGIVALTLTSLSVARERELGSFDQILVSPLKPYEILLGKAIPAVGIALIEGIMIFSVAVLFFKVPFVGSFFLLFFSIFVFVLSMVGVGLFISSFSQTQQQATLGTFVFLVPAITLSGYASPISSMPFWLQKTMILNPIAHFLVIIRGLFLKNISEFEVWSDLWPMMMIAFVTLSLSVWMFKKKME